MPITGTVTPASKEKIDAEIAELEASGANPGKLQRLKDHRALTWPDTPAEPKG